MEKEFIYMPNFGVTPSMYIKEILDERNISIETLSELLGYDLDTTKLIVYGFKKIDRDIANRLEKALGVSSRIFLNLEKRSTCCRNQKCNHNIDIQKNIKFFDNMYYFLKTFSKAETLTYDQLTAIYLIYMTNRKIPIPKLDFELIKYNDCYSAKLRNILFYYCVMELIDYSVRNDNILYFLTDEGKYVMQEMETKNVCNVSIDDEIINDIILYVTNTPNTILDIVKAILYYTNYKKTKLSIASKNVCSLFQSKRYDGVLVGDVVTHDLIVKIYSEIRELVRG